MKPTVFWLGERKARKPAIAGGKGASLARLTALGFPVPRGFVVPAGARPDADERWMKAIFDAVRRLDGPVAVRSSLVGEDSQLRSYAGQLDTVLNVHAGAELRDAVERVRASALRPHLRQYSESLDQKLPTRAAPGPDTLPDAPPAMAILIQEMVLAEAAGVAFSRDPITGRTTAIVEAVPGRGDRLVQGTVEPDRFVVDAGGRLTAEHRRALSAEVLSTEAVRAVAETVRAIADHTGLPQDMEWAWTSGALVVLQARPITTLAGKSIYSRKLIGDMVPGPIKPLVWSTNTMGMVEGVFGAVFTDLLGTNDFDFTRILRRIRSHAYVDTTFIGHLLAEVGLPRNFFDTVVRGDRASRRMEFSAGLLLKAPRLAASAWRYARMSRALPATVGAHDRALEELRRKDWSDATARMLIQHGDGLLRRHRTLQWCVMLGGMNLALRMRLLKRMVARHAPTLDPSRLLLGLRGLKSLEPNRRLEEIASTAGLRAVDASEAGQVEDITTVLLSGDRARIESALGRDDAGRQLASEVAAFLEEFGFLSANGTNFGEPTWAEAPATVWMALGRMIRDGRMSDVGAAPHARGRVPTDQHEADRRSTHDQVLEKLGPIGRHRFRKRLASATHFLELRETMSLLMTEDTYQLRRIFLALGRRLHGAGLLPAPEDVFYFDWDELRQAVDTPEYLPRVSSTLARRKAELEADRDAVLPETVVGDDVPMGPFEPEAASVLTGVPASAGFIRGTARVVRMLAEAPADLSRNDVLIVPFSDVGWTPLFATVGGIVAECGGQLSHTAIVAREYGLPAVVGVRGAVASIPDGRTVMVDGGGGRVYLDGDAPGAPS